jgi:5-methylcytosine-specific restriction enzyme B
MLNDQVLSVVERQLALQPRLLAAWAGRAEQAERQRTLFLREYAPSRLDALTLDELLVAVPFNLSHEAPLDYWLDTRQDSAFDTSRFGAVAGASLLKYGLWQDKESGAWRAKASAGGHRWQEVSQEDALEVVEGRRAELIAAAKALEGLALRDIDSLDLAQVQQQVQQAAPTWHHSGWLHKYLHLCCPQLVGPHHSLAAAQAACCRVGVAPPAGLYGCDVALMQFWEAVCVLVPLPMWARHHILGEAKPRRHWLLKPPDLDSARRMLKGGWMGLGPRPDLSLGPLLRPEGAKGGRGSLHERLKALFLVQGLEPERGEVKALARLVATIESDHLVGLLSPDGQGLLATGRVRGGYTHEPRDEVTSHRRGVQWLRAATRPDLHPDLAALDGDGLLSVPMTHPLAAALEALCLIHDDAALIAPAPSPEAGSARDGLASVLGASAERPQPSPGEPGAAAPSRAALPAPTGRERHLIEMLARRGQLILYGPPGTGKTYWGERVALSLLSRHHFGCLPTELTPAQWDRVLGRDGQVGYLSMCTFHPSYGYEDFVEGYRADGRGGFAVQPGLLKRLAGAAAAAPKALFILMIDEINRGNIPKIFGELITLLEMSRRGQTLVHLPLSGDLFTVPCNLLLIGTMNTADRSILLLDTALRRRFAFCELLPDPDVLGDARVGPLSLAGWLRSLNRRLLEQLGHDARALQVGHAYFMPGGEPIGAAAALAAVIQDELWPLLQSYCYEDGAALRGIFGELLEGDGMSLRLDLFEGPDHQPLLRVLAAMAENG